MVVEFVVFIMVFNALLCVTCVLVGAHIMHSKQAQVSPINTLPPLRNLLVPETKSHVAIDDKEMYGYYD